MLAHTGGVRIEPFDIDDEAAFSTWFDIVHASELEELPDEPGWLAPELAAIARNETEFESVLALGRDDDGAACGALFVQFPKVDNLTEANIFHLAVRPDRRGRGAGRELLGYLEAMARERGRTKLIVSTNVPVDTPHPRSARFAAAAGFEPGLRSAKRAYRFPIDERSLDHLEAEAGLHAAGYAIETWTGPCPGPLRPGRRALAEAIARDAPQGVLDKDPEIWDEDRLATFESMVGAMDRTSYSAGAVTSTGDLVAFNEVTIARTNTEVGWQFDTIVLPEHRGHRLGTLVKIANLRAIAAASPETMRIFTYNALDNAPMIAINDALGFEVASFGTVWMKSIA